MIFEDRIELLKQKDAACRLEYQELLTFVVDLLTINCLSEARKYIDKAFALVPEDEQLLILYGNAELFGKNYLKALPYFLKYYDRNPIDRCNLVFLVSTYRALNDDKNYSRYNNELQVLGGPI